MAGREENTPSAPAWAVLSVRTVGCTDHMLTTVLSRHCGPNSRLRLCRGGGDILAPAADLGQALDLAHRVAADLPHSAWISAVWRPSQELDSAVREAVGILDVVSALRRRPGIYRLDDVALEYAVADSPGVSRHLVGLIEPVVTRPELLETLEALIAADGNRARAATELIIHRSTIDYRLRQIEKLTGQSPTRVRGLQTLCTALAARALAQPRVPPRYTERPRAVPAAVRPSGART